MSYYETIVLCQPDGRKSCSACCGLFNFRDISRENLSLFLITGAARSASCLSAGDFTDQGDSSAIRDRASYICPHQGLIFNKRPGCLIHPQYRSAAMRNDAFFGETICNGFLCPAHSLLSSEQKKLIIELMDDWYNYTIALIDPESTIWFLDLLRDRYPVVFQRQDLLKKVFNDYLAIHSAYLAEYSGPIFHYSIAEYNLGKENYSLDADTAETDFEKAEIIKVIEQSL
jgi:hypothetical protein